MSCRNMYRVTQSTDFGRQHLMPDCYSFFFFKLVVNQYSILIKFIIKCLYKHILAFLVGCPRTLRSNHSCAFPNLNTSFAQLHWMKYAPRWLHFESTVHIIVTYTGSSAIIDENLIRLYNQYGVSILPGTMDGKKGMSKLVKNREWEKQEIWSCNMHQRCNKNHLDKKKWRGQKLDFPKDGT